MIFCEQCGNKLNEGIKFCGKCGAPVPVEQTEDTQSYVQDMSASGACPQCGAPIEEGEMFCANCGAKVGAVPQYQQPAPALVQPQVASEQVLKEGTFFLDKSYAPGSLVLYKNRLEWKGCDNKNFVIPINIISSVNKSTLWWGANVLKILLDNKNKYVFLKNFGNKDQQIAQKEKQELQSWVDAINNARNGTL